MSYKTDKVERYAYLDELKKAFLELYAKETEEDAVPSKVLEYVFDQELQRKLTEFIFTL